MALKSELFGYGRYMGTGEQFKTHHNNGTFIGPFVYCSTISLTLDYLLIE